MHVGAQNRLGLAPLAPAGDHHHVPVVGDVPDHLVPQVAAVHGYTTAFTVSGLIFVGAASLTGLLLPPPCTESAQPRRGTSSPPKYAAAAEPSGHLALPRRPVTE